MEENWNARSPNSHGNSRVPISRLAINGTTEQTGEIYGVVFGHANKSNRGLPWQLHALCYRAKHRNIKHHHAIRSGSGWPGMQVDATKPVRFLQNTFGPWIILHPAHDGRGYRAFVATVALTRASLKTFWVPFLRGSHTAAGELWGPVIFWRLGGHRPQPVGTKTRANRQRVPRTFRQREQFDDT